MLKNYPHAEGNDKVYFISLAHNDLSKVDETLVKIIHILALTSVL